MDVRDQYAFLTRKNYTVLYYIIYIYPGFQAGRVEISEKKKNSNTHPYKSEFYHVFGEGCCGPFLM